MKKSLLVILLVLLVYCIVLSQDRIGPLQKNHVYTLKIRGLKTGLRFIVNDDVSRRVSLSDDGTSIGAVWLVSIGQTVYRRGPLSTKAGKFDYVIMNPSMRNSERLKDENCCHLAGIIDSGHLRISTGSWDNVWTAIDNEDGTVVLKWMPDNALVYPETLLIPTGEFYLFADPKTGEFKYVANPEDATSWYSSEVSVEDLISRKKKAWGQ